MHICAGRLLRANGLDDRAESAVDFDGQNPSTRLPLGPIFVNELDASDRRQQRRNNKPIEMAEKVSFVGVAKCAWDIDRSRNRWLFDRTI